MLPVDIQMCNIVIDSTDHSHVIVWPKIIHIISGLTNSYMTLNVWTQKTNNCIMRVVIRIFYHVIENFLWAVSRQTNIMRLSYSWNIKVSLDWMPLLQFSIVSLMILNIKNTYTCANGCSQSTGEGIWPLCVHQLISCNRGTFIITVMTSDKRTARVHNLITNLIILSL